MEPTSNQFMKSFLSRLLESHQKQPLQAAPVDRSLDPCSLAAILQRHREQLMMVSNSTADPSSAPDSCSTPEVIKRLLAIEANHLTKASYEQKLAEAMQSIREDIAAKEASAAVNNNGDVYSVNNSNTAEKTLLAEHEVSLEEYVQQVEQQQREDLVDFLKHCLEQLKEEELRQRRRADVPNVPPTTNPFDMSPYFIVLSALLDVISESSLSPPSSSEASSSSVNHLSSSGFQVRTPLPQELITELSTEFTSNINTLIIAICAELKELSNVIFQNSPHHNTGSQTTTEQVSFSVKMKKVKERFHVALALLSRLFSERTFLEEAGNQMSDFTMKRLLIILLPYWLKECPQYQFNGNQHDHLYQHFRQFTTPVVDFFNRHLLFKENSTGAYNMESGDGGKLPPKSSFLAGQLSAFVQLLHQLSSQSLQVVLRMFGKTYVPEGCFLDVTNLPVNGHFGMDGSRRRAFQLAKALLTELWAMLRTVVDALGVLPTEELYRMLTGSPPLPQKTLSSGKKSFVESSLTAFFQGEIYRKIFYFNNLGNLILDLDSLYILYKAHARGTEDASQNILDPDTLNQGLSSIHMLFQRLFATLCTDIWYYFGLLDNHEGRQRRSAAEGLEWLLNQYGYVREQPPTTAARNDRHQSEAITIEDGSENVAASSSSSSSSSSSESSNASTGNFEIITIVENYTAEQQNDERVEHKSDHQFELFISTPSPSPSPSASSSSEAATSSHEPGVEVLGNVQQLEPFRFFPSSPPPPPSQSSKVDQLEEDIREIKKMLKTYNKVIIDLQKVALKGMMEKDSK